MDDIAVLVNALGWTLIHFLWQGMLVASLMWLLLKLIPQQRSRPRYLVGVGLYFLLLPVSVNTFIFFFKSATAAPAVMSINMPMVSVAAGVRPGLDFWLNEGIEPLLPLVVLLWALGVSVLALRTLIGWAGTRILVRKNVESISADLQQRVDGLIDRLQVRQAVAVLVSGRVKVPTVIGWIKPVILLPASVLVRLPVQQLEMIIAHELGHIHRYDYVINLLQVVIDTLFFYHPQVRWMSRCIRQEREHCCDDFVLKHECKPVVYARALANLEILRQPANATALAATGGDLLHRVHRIANGEFPRKSAGFAQFAMMLALVTVAGMGARSGLEVGLHSPTGQLPDVFTDDQFSFSASIVRPAGWESVPDPYGQIRQGIKSHKNRNEENKNEEAVMAKRGAIAKRPVQKLYTEPVPRVEPDNKHESRSGTGIAWQ
jgi:beta-lactamase regulating signal transducer with metallopeptidase domain